MNVVLANVMPRYGTLEHRRIGVMLMAALAIALLMLVPDFAFADGFKGSFAVNNELGGNVDNSFKSWWKFLAVPGLWIAMIWLVVCVTCLRSQGWQIPLVLAAIFMFGEMFVTAVKGMMG